MSDFDRIDRPNLHPALAEVADILREASQEHAPPLELDPVAKMLGLVPEDPRPLLSWLGTDYSAPLPWVNIPCRACSERELAKHFVGTATDFVCMACGDVQKVEER